MRHFYQVEVESLVKNEWAMTAQDILSRRPKIGVTISRHDEAKLDEFLQHWWHDTASTQQRTQESSAQPDSRTRGR